MQAFEKTQRECKSRNQTRALRGLEADAGSVSENESEEEEWVSEDDCAGAASVKSKPYFVSTPNHSKSAVRTSLSVDRNRARIHSCVLATKPLT